VEVQDSSRPYLQIKPGLETSCGTQDDGQEWFCGIARCIQNTPCEHHDDPASFPNASPSTLNPTHSVFFFAPMISLW
jgi:hypothetical protein